MILLITSTKAQDQIAKNLKNLRVSKGLTQAGLAERSGVSLPTLRKFEQKGLISLESFIKLCMSLGCLENILEATQLEDQTFNSLDDVLKNEKPKSRKRGWKS